MVSVLTLSSALVSSGGIIDCVPVCVSSFSLPTAIADAVAAAVLVWLSTADANTLELLVVPKIRVKDINEMASKLSPTFVFLITD